MSILSALFNKEVATNTGMKMSEVASFIGGAFTANFYAKAIPNPLTRSALGGLTGLLSFGLIAWGVAGMVHKRDYEVSLKQAMLSSEVRQKMTLKMASISSFVLGAFTTNFYAQDVTDMPLRLALNGLAGLFCFSLTFWGMSSYYDKKERLAQGDSQATFYGSLFSLKIAKKITLALPELLSFVSAAYAANYFAGYVTQDEKAQLALSGAAGFVGYSLAAWGTEAKLYSSSPQRAFTNLTS